MSDRPALPPAAAAIRDGQVERAFRRLEGRGELTAEERVVLERLADRLTATLIGMFDAEGTAVETT